MLYSIITLLQGCHSKIVELQYDNMLLEQFVHNKSVELNNLVASCQQAVRTHPDDKLLERHCYKSAEGLLQLVCFYVCVAEDLLHAYFPSVMHLGKQFRTDIMKNYIPAPELQDQWSPALQSH
jgi:hypothetical protein